MEFVRGPQSALFGRNTLGGLVNVSSVRPSLSKWTGSAVVPFGNFDAIDVRANASGPIGKKAALGFAFGRAKRDGFTTNDITGKDIDFRDGTFGKAQLLLTPTAQWEARLIFTGERARDGDYALMDLGSLRQRPLHAARNFEGHTRRNVDGTTLLVRHEGKKLTFSSTTGHVLWKTDDATDLDYTPLPLITRTNVEKDARSRRNSGRLAGGTGALSIGLAQWQLGFLFSQTRAGFEQQLRAVRLSPFLTSRPAGVAAELDDKGFGLYGHGTIRRQGGSDAGTLGSIARAQRGS